MFEEPTTFQTRMLEQHWVIPLPLSVITKKKEMEAALRAFLELLREPLGEPQPKWCLPRHLKNEVPAKEPPFPPSPSSDDWVNAAIAWRANRESYPGWIVPHMKAIEDLWSNTESWAERAEANPEELSSMDPPTCIFVLFELLWRTRRAIFPAYDRLAQITWEQALSRYASWRDDQPGGRVLGSGDTTIKIDLAELDSAVLEIQLERLRHARETGQFDRFERVLAEARTSIQTPPTQLNLPKNAITYEIVVCYGIFGVDKNATRVYT